MECSLSESLGCKLRVLWTPKPARESLVAGAPGSFSFIERPFIPQGSLVRGGESPITVLHCSFPVESDAPAATPGTLAFCSFSVVRFM
jgi:hypothetical protein